MGDERGLIYADWRDRLAPASSRHGVHIHAVVISVAIDDYELAKAALLEQVVPQVKQAPGFIAGYWVNVRREQGRDRKSVV